jgi:hypothetical protein
MQTTRGDATLWDALVICSGFWNPSKRVPYSASACSRPETHMHLPEHCHRSWELFLRVLLFAVSSVECSKAEVAVGDYGSNPGFAASVSAFP